jgi:hypothetical protein
MSYGISECISMEKTHEKFKTRLMKPCDSICQYIASARHMNGLNMDIEKGR